MKRKKKQQPLRASFARRNYARIEKRSEKRQTKPRVRQLATRRQSDSAAEGERERERGRAGEALVELIQLNE